MYRVPTTILGFTAEYLVYMYRADRGVRRIYGECDLPFLAENPAVLKGLACTQVPEYDASLPLSVISLNYSLPLELVKR